MSQATDKEKQEEGKKIVAELAKLKYEIQHDRNTRYGLIHTRNIVSRLS